MHYSEAVNAANMNDIEKAEKKIEYLERKVREIANYA